MASIVASPNPGTVGKPVVIAGEGFGNAVEVTISVVQAGFQSEIVCTASGQVATDAIADHATVTLTGTNNPSAGETMTLGSRVYTFRASVATFAGVDNILIGAALTNTLDNIKAAINGASGEGSLYSYGTVRHQEIYASNKTATTVVFHARRGGADFNTLASTETLSNNSFGAATLSGGAAAGAKAMNWLPTKEGTYDITATDGTNSAATTVRIFTSA